MTKVYEKDHFTVEEMAVEFGVSYRTMLRYLQELSGLGVPLYSEFGKNGGYSVLKTKNKPAPPQNSPRSVRRVIKPAFQMVGIELKAPFTAVHMSNALIPKLWEQWQSRKGEIGAWARTAVQMAAIQNRERVYQYIAGVEVRRIATIPDGMTGLTVSAREYAVYTHHGIQRRDELDDTYMYALKMIKSQGMEPEPHAYSLQIFTKGQPMEIGDSEIYVPIRSMA